MTQRLDEGVAKQQKLIEQSNLQQGKATQHLLDITQQSPKPSSEQFKRHKSASKQLSDFGTDLQVSLQEIPAISEWSSIGGESKELAGQSLLDQAQEAGQKLQQAMSRSSANAACLGKYGSEMVLHLGQIHRQYSES